MAKPASRFVVNLNADTQKKRTHLHIFASKGFKGLVNILLETGADINAQDENKRTPLHCSVDNGHKNVVGILLKAGANVNAQNDKLVTPLHVAVYRGHTEIVEMLLKAYANANAANYIQMTPLHYAACWGHAKIVETLLKADANADAADFKTMTPLHFAARYGNKKVVETLIKAGANVDVANNTNMTPLHYAACFGHVEIVEMLIKANTNADAADDTKMTSLHHAARGGHAEIVEMLLKAGANVNATCDSGYTPLFYSDVECHHEVSEFLLKCGAKQCIWKWFAKPVSSPSGNKTFALGFEIVFHTQFIKTVYVPRKSTDGVSNHSEYSHTSIMTCEPRDDQTDVTPNTDFVSDIKKESSCADCVTLPSSGRTANSFTVISDHTQAKTSALPLGFSLQGCEDIRKQVEDHWAKFSLLHKSQKGQCSTDVTSVLKNDIITINIPTTIKVVQKNYTQESLYVSHTEFLNVNSTVNVNRLEPADSDADTDDSDGNDNGLKDNNEE